ncbi:hypothetical protein PPO43_15110 [Saprospira sp. CCB-QB6]|uniref:hypothetical protein n=1 Tax=Saprospira sp. CCB-QB6 TaxID=3023936 RepID=UPI00234BB964|nr:hypothetical protein [Saprospira sp. CCB-QB6]WCL81303.1 hypothetical protein PPO43_15110 [Saprospira sp. CCB-QB6]
MESIIRMRGALASLPFMTDDKEGLLRQWLGQMRPFMETETRLLNSTAFNQSDVCWGVESEDHKLLAKRFAEFVKIAGLNENELKVFKKGLQIAAAQGKLQLFIELGENRQNTGWAFNGQYPLSQTLKLVPASEHRDKIETWYAQFDADAAVLFGRSLAADTYSFFATELFGETPSQNADLHIDQAKALNVNPLPDALLGILVEDEPNYMESFFKMSKTGLLEMGLRIPAPSSKMITKLALVLGNSGLDGMAAYEGSLGNGFEKRFLQISRRSTGIIAQTQFALI